MGGMCCLTTATWSGSTTSSSAPRPSCPSILPLLLCFTEEKRSWQRNQKCPQFIPFCQKLYESLPPHIVEEEAKRSREEKEKERMRERRVARGEKDGKGLSLFAQIVIFTAPVFLGIVVWRLYGASNGV